MKTFKDLKKGDYIYELEGTKLYKYLVVKELETLETGFLHYYHLSIRSNFDRRAFNIYPEPNDILYNDLFGTFFSDIEQVFKIINK